MEPLAISLGTIVAKVVFKSWVGDGVVGDVSGDLTDLVGRNIPGFLEGRRARRQFEQISEVIGARLEPLISVEFATLPPDEREAAVIAVRDTLTTTPVTAPILVAVDLDAEALERHLRASDPERASRAGLAEAATAFYDLLLAEICHYVVNIADRFPGFATEESRQLLQRETGIIEVVQELLDRLPPAMVPQEWGLGSEDVRFENKYTRSLTDRLDFLQLYGVDSASSRRKYSLSVAYISLSASLDVASAGQHPARSRSADEVAGGDAAQIDTSVRVETALGGGARVLVGGQAGSGKTTLLQWLAVTACRAEFTGDLSDWNGRIPFFVRLRQYNSDGFPTPSGIVKATVPNISDAMPEGWANRVLASGRGILLVDGVDELSESRRGPAREWLESLLNDYPALDAVITSRSVAISKDWRELAGFKHTELLPMDIGDVRALVSHWHAAAAVGLPAEEQAALRETELRMLQAVRDNVSIRNLCTSPLLCALVCALHRDKSGKLPKNRMELYDSALKTLLIDRDVEREVAEPTGGTALSFTDRRALLSDFAKWLLENGQVDATDDTYAGRIAAGVRTLPHARGSAKVVAQLLLQRSGVLRRPVEGRVDFIHKTFMEYLAAAAIVEEEGIDKLVLHADEDAWREVIIMACGHATVVQREKLLLLLIERGERESEIRHSLLLLAVACLETASRLSPDVRSRVEGCLTEVIPPANMTEAAAVASAGAVAVAPLSAFRGTAIQVAACVRGLSLIGDDAALEALRGYRNDGRVTVIRQLIRAWGQFDAERYAREVLVDSKLDYGRLTITDPELLRYTPILNGLKAVELDAPGRIESLHGYADFDKLVSLNTSHSSAILNFEGLAGSTSLAALQANSCRSLRSLTGLEGLPLTWLSVTGCPSLVDVSALQFLSQLKRLYLSQTPVTDISPLARTSSSLSYIGLTFMSELRRLPDNLPTSSLRIGHCPKLESFDNLATWADLRILEISGSLARSPVLQVPNQVEELTASVFDGLERLRLGSGLKSLTVWGVDDEQLFEEAARLPGLESLTVDTGSAELSFNALQYSTSLRDLSVWTDELAIKQRLVESGVPGYRLVGNSAHFVNFVREGKPNRY